MAGPVTIRILVALLLGLTAAAANVLGGSLIAHRQWSRILRDTRVHRRDKTEVFGHDG